MCGSECDVQRKATAERAGAPNNRRWPAGRARAARLACVACLFPYGYLGVWGARATRNGAPPLAATAKMRAALACLGCLTPLRGPAELF